MRLAGRARPAQLALARIRPHAGHAGILPQRRPLGKRGPNKLACHGPVVSVVQWLRGPVVPVIQWPRGSVA
jgi:hypothetical protein